MFNLKISNSYECFVIVALLCVWESHSEKVTNQSPSAMDSSQQMTVEDRNSRWDVEKNELNKVDSK